MSAAVRIVLNSSAVRDLLRSDAVAADLEERGAKIAARADENAGDPDGHSMSTFAGRNRVRVEIATATPKAMEQEATIRSLSSALDAGRGPVTRTANGRYRDAEGRFISAAEARRLAGA